MSKEDIVFVASVQHTGTWFVLDMLKKHPDIHSVRLMEDLTLIKEEMPDNKKQVIHSHISTSDHVHPREHGKYLNPIMLLSMMNYYKTVITIRDPMKSLISRYLRSPGFDYKYIVDGFVFIAELAITSNNIFPIPVDLLKQSNLTVRRDVIRCLAKHFGISYTPAMENAAYKWLAPAYNITCPSNIKDSYEKGELGLVNSVIKEDVCYLQSKEDIIRPFLEYFGYANLPWWSD